MKKTILLALILWGGAHLCGAAQIKYYNDSKNVAQLPDDLKSSLLQLDLDFAITFNVDGLEASEYNAEKLWDNNVIHLHYSSWNYDEIHIDVAYHENCWVMEYRCASLESGSKIVLSKDGIESFTLGDSATCVLQYTVIDETFSFYHFDGESLNRLVSLSCEDEYFPTGSDLNYVAVYLDSNNRNHEFSEFAVWQGVVTAADLVPEPATATLSLLALAGLAARRRRK